MSDPTCVRTIWSRTPGGSNTRTAILCVPWIQGCVAVVDKDPEYSEIELQNLTLTNPPEITLVRRVIPEHSTKKAGFYVDLGQIEEISSSDFGGPDDIADLSCAIDGIRKSLPEVDIVPTEMFWERVAAQKEAMDLSELLTSPTSRRWEELRVDFLVVAYHQIVDVEEFFTEVVLFGGYRKESLETAAILVFDLRNQKIVHASKVIFEDEDGYARQLFVFTIGYVSTATSDPCNVAGEQAGAAASRSAPGSRACPCAAAPRATRAG